MIIITTRASSKTMPIIAKRPAPLRVPKWIPVDGVAVGCGVGGCIGVAVGIMMGVAVGCGVAVDAGVAVGCGVMVARAVGVVMLVAVASCSFGGEVRPASPFESRAAIARIGRDAGRSPAAATARIR
jgi:hypothetical protein